MRDSLLGRRNSGKVRSMPSMFTRRQSWAGSTSSSGADFRSSKAMVRSASTNFTVFNKKSPLLDLAPVAHPGVSQRLIRRGSMSVHVDMVHKAFQDDIHELDEDELAEVLGGVTSKLILGVIAACMPAMQYGFNLASMNTAAPVMRKDLGIPKNGRAVNSLIWSFCVSALPLAGIFGAKAGAALADKFGRRKGLMILSFAFVIGALLCVVSKFFVEEGETGWSAGVILFIAGRLVCGLSGGATTVVVPKYIGEIAPPHLRGALGAVFQTSQVCWMLLTQVLGLPSFMGTSELWQMYILILEISPGLVLLALIPWLVESPYWASQLPNGQEMVYSILMSLRGYELNDEDLDEEAEAILQPGRLSGGGGSKGGFKQMWADDAARRGLAIAVFIGAAQQLSGINNVFNFSTEVLQDNHIPEDTITIIAVAMNVGNVINSILASALLDRAGRRPLLLGSATGMAVSGFILTYALTVEQPIVIIAGVVGFVMSFGMGMGPLPWLLPCELFAPEYSSNGVSAASTVNWLANFICAMTFQSIAEQLGTFCFLPNAIFLAFFVMWASRTLPETRGKTLDLIVQELAGVKNGKSESFMNGPGISDEHPIAREQGDTLSQTLVHFKSGAEVIQTCSTDSV
mmetsp:Transcript_86718/g.163502  ORF Transcript_86718/g.163502 Transcript_86718/m.163502 type:complete len:630 (-) Transcript_86718:182-2071(-)